MAIKLTPHFTLQELTVTKTGLSNIPSDEEIDNLRKLCRDVLEPIRATIGSPIIVNSAYRSPAVNSAVGGVSTSQHLKGQAADIHVINMSSLGLFHTIKNMVANGQIHVGQCILYPNFVHVSLHTSHYTNQFIVKNKN